jgi:hypothetical protein
MVSLLAVESRKWSDNTLPINLDSAIFEVRIYDFPLCCENREHQQILLRFTVCFFATQCQRE